KSIVAQGKATQDGSATSLALSVKVSGINPEAADPYLAAVRLSRTFKDGQFSWKLEGRRDAIQDGSLIASLKVLDSTLTDDNRQLFSMPLIDFQNATIDPKTSSVRIEAV